MTTVPYKDRRDYFKQYRKDHRPELIAYKKRWDVKQRAKRQSARAINAATGQTDKPA